MNTWITADWHCGEDRFELMGRPFTSPLEMVNQLVQYHNDLVAPDDLVLMVGDAVYQKTPNWLPNVARFNGQKILFRGNHDAVFTDKELREYFMDIVPEGEGREYTFCGILCWVNHYPTLGRQDRFNLYGHIHAAHKYQLNGLNIGIDVHNFRPVNTNKIGFHYDAICKYYDNDVWIAYNEINSSYLGKRGKKGSYYEPKNQTAQ